MNWDNEISTTDMDLDVWVAGLDDPDGALSLSVDALEEMCRNANEDLFITAESPRVLKLPQTVNGNSGRPDPDLPLHVIHPGPSTEQASHRWSSSEIDLLYCIGMCSTSQNPHFFNTNHIWCQKPTKHDAPWGGDGKATGEMERCMHACMYVCVEWACHHVITVGSLGRTEATALVGT